MALFKNFLYKGERRKNLENSAMTSTDMNIHTYIVVTERREREINRQKEKERISVWTSRYV